MEIKNEEEYLDAKRAMIEYTYSDFLKNVDGDDRLTADTLFEEYRSFCIRKNRTPGGRKGLFICCKKLGLFVVGVQK